MMGTWPLGIIDRDMLGRCLEHLRESGYDQVTLIVEHMPARGEVANVSHMMYWLVCTDPDGEWFWLNDADDTAWSEVKVNKLDSLNIEGHSLTIIVVH